MNTKSTANYRKRLMILVFFVFIGGLLLLGRLFQVQIFLHNYYSGIASKQHNDRIKLELPRGRIFDRRGAILSLDIPRSYSFGVHPKQVGNRYRVAQAMAKATGERKSLYLDRLDSEANFVWLERQLDIDRAKPIMKINGLIQKCETKRFYPYAMHTPKAIGFTDRDCKGIAGLEEIYNKELQSSPGWETVLEDAFGKQFENPVYSRIDPVPGSDLVLTFDNVIQELVCRELASAVEKHHAKGGMAMVMLPRTGEILAMASLPDFDPNDPGNYSDSQRREKNVVDIFEPGSTFKLVPALAAMEKGMALSRIIDCGNGKYKVGIHTIKDIHRYPSLTFEDVIINSSNVGTARIARWVGADDLYLTARNLGFGAPTGIEIPGEGRGILSNPKNWDKYQLATIGIGQGVSVSAIQLTFAYSAIANDGVLMRPRIVRSITNPAGQTKDTMPVQVRRVTKRKYAEKLTAVLVKVTERGTGTAAKIEGLRIAGKTGTAQKPMTDKRGYSEDKFVSTFIGFTIDEPRLLCMVIIDEPVGQHYGGIVSAPVFKNIMEKAFPIVTAEQNEYHGPLYRPKDHRNFVYETPDLINLDREKAMNMLGKKKLNAEIIGDGKKVTAQHPLPGSIITKNDTLILYAETVEDKIKLDGFPVREAVKKLISAGYNVKVIGNGLVSSAKFSGGSCTLYCKENQL